MDLSRDLADFFGLAKLLAELGLDEFDKQAVKDAVQCKLANASKEHYETWRQARFLLLGPDKRVGRPFAELVIASANFARQTYERQLHMWRQWHTSFGLPVPAQEAARGDRIFQQWWFWTAFWIRQVEEGKLLKKSKLPYKPNAKRREQAFQTFTDK